MLLDPELNEVWQVDLPDRGHGGAFNPIAGECAIFARRPGTFAVIADRSTGEIRQMLSAPADRHFYGHGCYSTDGRMLFTTENDFDGARGVIGVWDAGDGYQRIGEFESFGIGPHDICRLPDGQTLVVANGGIATHPETGRGKLNIPDMEPSLVFLDARDGRLLCKTTLPREFHKLSIRHLAIGAKNTVFAAMQYEGPSDDAPPLILRFDGTSWDLVSAPFDTQRQMKNYCGSVAFDRSKRVAAVSCPRGGLMTYWSSQGDFIRSEPLPDVCGVSGTSNDGEFLVSGGFGEIGRFRAVKLNQIPLQPAPGINWDNHIVGDLL